MSELFGELHRIITLSDASDKCEAATELNDSLPQWRTQHDSTVVSIESPGLPESLRLVAPRELKRRGVNSQTGRNILLHAIAHIEFNAINLALDAAYRFRRQPQDYYHDWIGIAADEARHFCLVRDYLQHNDCDYGDYPVHNGLWEMALQTADDVVARMALVPRVLEARGLDVTPAMIKRLTAVDDGAAVAILKVIYEDEIGHVACGSKWFAYQCRQRALEPRQTFIDLVEQHLHGGLRGPFNLAARLQAGFDEVELAGLQRHSSESQR